MPGPPQDGMERLIIDIPNGMKDELKAQAAGQDLYMSQLVRRILTDAINRYKKENK